MILLKDNLPVGGRCFIQIRLLPHRMQRLCKSREDGKLLPGQESVCVTAKQVQSGQSKWYKTRLLLKNQTISPFIPDTRRFTRRNLEQMIHSYGMIYVKPERGTYGNGVIRAERGNGRGIRTSMRKRGAISIRLKLFIKVWRRRSAERAIWFKKVSIC